jgi:pyrophosphatase PpaX
MALHTILFDLDGTLIDSVELILRSKQYAFESRGLTPPSDAEWLRWLGTPLRNTFARYADGSDEVDRFIDAYREFQLAHHDALVRSYDGVFDAVAALRAAGHPQGS